MKTLGAVLVLLAAASPLFASPISDETRRALVLRREQVRRWAPTCHGHLSEGGCAEGDMDLFAGELCLSGEAERCRDVANAQAMDGRWLRSQERLGPGGDQDFSRDQAMGVLAYLTATRDAERAGRWMDWIERHPVTPVFNSYLAVASMCTPLGNTNCYLYLDSWGLFGRLWRELGLEPNAPMRRFMAGGVDEKIFLALSRDPLFPKDHSGRHLYAVNAWIRGILAGRRTRGVEAMARRLKKEEPANAFFLWLADGPSEELARYVLRLLPAEPPAQPWIWAWSAEGGDPRLQTESMGWDQIMLINLLLK